MHQIVCRLGLCPRPTGGAYTAPPDPLASLGVGPREGEKEGGEWTGVEARASRNAQIQRWQAYHQQTVP